MRATSASEERQRPAWPGNVGGACMAIFVDADTKVLVQGLTGGQGRFHGLRNRDYGTKVVAGVTPGKGGQDVDGIPVFDSVAEAVAATGATASFVAVPPKAAPAAILEAAAAGIAFVVCITEGIPAQDEARDLQPARARLPGHTAARPELPGRDQPRQVQHRHHADRHRPAAERRSAQRRDRQPLRHAHLPGAVRAQAQRHRRVVVRRDRRRPGAGDELRRLPRRVREGPGDPRHDPVRRDRRLGRGGGRRLHQGRRVEADERLHRRRHGATRAARWATPGRSCRAARARRRGRWRRSRPPASASGSTRRRPAS